MNEEWDKMLNGQEYDALQPQLLEKLIETRKRIKIFNDTDPEDTTLLQRLLRDIIGECGENLQINQPFRCDYGCNISLGENCFINFNCTILDEGKVSIGSNAFIGPNVSIFTACHPLEPRRRNKYIEWAEPVKIGNNVWIGGNVTILPGVEIGDNVTIGAGSVVTKSFPSDVVIGGNPARIIKTLPKED